MDIKKKWLNQIRASLHQLRKYVFPVVESRPNRTGRGVCCTSNASCYKYWFFSSTFSV